MEHQERTNERQSDVLRRAYQAADSLKETGEAAWRKISRWAQMTHERLRDEMPSSEASPTLVEQGPQSPPTPAPPVERGPSGVDIVSSAASPDEQEPVPAIVDEETRDVEHIAPIGSGMAKEMLRQAQGE